MKTSDYISSLSNVKITKGRRQGNTTRIINNAIELLFKGYTVKVEDHSNHPYADKQLLRLIKDRLVREFSLEEKDINVNNNGNLLLTLNFDESKTQKE